MSFSLSPGFSTNASKEETDGGGGDEASGSQVVREEGGAGGENGAGGEGGQGRGGERLCNTGIAKLLMWHDIVTRWPGLGFRVRGLGIVTCWHGDLEFCESESERERSSERVREKFFGNNTP